MKTLVFGIMCFLISTNLIADQESQKSRLDDCFAVVGDMLSQMNSIQGKAQAPAFGQAFMNKKAQCYQFKNEYEKKYGKYKVLLPKMKVVNINPNKLNDDELVKYYCSRQDEIKTSQDQIELLKNAKGPDNDNSIKANQNTIRISQEEIKALQKAYKKKFNNTLEESECDDTIFSEKKYIRSLKRNIEVDAKGKRTTDDQNPKKLKDLFCKASEQEKEVLNKLHKKITGEDATCKRDYGNQE